MSGGANLDGERLSCKHLHGNLGSGGHIAPRKFLNLEALRSYFRLFYSYR